MSKGDIPISPKHGVNPSLLVCLFCGKDTGSIALVGRLPGDAEAPKRMRDREPCNECKQLMTKGFMLVEATGGKHGPIPTGRMWVVTHEAAREIFKDACDLSKGVAWLEVGAAEIIGLTNPEIQP